MSALRRLFCFGLGYSAMALAERLLAEGWRVAETCRSADKAQALAARDIEPFLFDRNRPLDDAPAALAGTTHLLSSVPPGETGDAVLTHHGDAFANLEWVGYLSTTGVYGDRGGGIVDEDAPLEPTSARARQRIRAEAAWLELWRTRGLPVHVFRLAGIYGPGRSALDTVRAGTAKRIDLPGHMFSRINVSDVATVLRASIEHPNPGRIYNVADDEPAPSEAVIAYACELLGVPVPPLVPLEQAGLSPLALSFYRDNKRVRDRKSVV